MSSKNIKALNLPASTQSTDSTSMNSTSKPNQTCYLSFSAEEISQGSSLQHNLVSMLESSEASGQQDDRSNHNDSEFTSQQLNTLQ